MTGQARGGMDAITKLAALVAAPLTTLLTTPVMLIRALGACGALAGGRWRPYAGFTPSKALNQTAYWTLADNFAAVGREGSSPLMSAGAFPLRQLWFITLPSLYAFRNMGVAAVLLGMFGWWGGHFVWLDGSRDVFWACAVCAMLLAGSNFYLNAFLRQNYNALGWMLVPAGLWAWGTGHWALASLLWLGASFLSFTVVFLVGALSVFASLQAWSPLPLLTMVPASLKLATHWYPFLGGGGLLSAVGTVARDVGATDGGVRYSVKMVGPAPHRIYFLALYAQFFAASWALGGALPWLVLGGVLLYVVNSLVARFVDDQSMYMLMASVAAATAMAAEPSVWLAASLWLVSSPSPYFYWPPNRSLLMVPPVRPFDVSTLVADLEAFLAPVGRGGRLLMEHSDPGRDYGAIFGAGPHLVSPLAFAARQLGVLVLPDRWFITQFNVQGAPDTWCEGPGESSAKMDEWDARFLLVSRPEAQGLEPDWERAGFGVVSSFAWDREEFRRAGEYPYPEPGDPPRWWLLERGS